MTRRDLPCVTCGIRAHLRCYWCRAAVHRIHVADAACWELHLAASHPEVLPLIRMVVVDQRRRAIGVDLSPQYTALAVKRMEEMPPPMGGGGNVL